MKCKICGKPTDIVVKIDGFSVPLCQKHYHKHSMEETERYLDKLLADMRAGKPPKSSPETQALAKKAVERMRKRGNMDR